MSEPEDPPRLFESGDAPVGLRDALRGARDDVGSAHEVSRLAARLGPLLGPPPVVAPPPSAALSGTFKLGLGALALVAAGGGAWLLSSPSKAPAPAPAPAPSAVTTAAPTLPSAPEPAAPEPSVSSASAAVMPEKPVPRVQLSEAELLEQARSALKSGDAARALQRANEHAARFPRGVLVQEREVLAIQALRRLGRSAEAERRAEAFAKAFPGSAFQRKLER